jgi:hypothetical protein
MELPRLSHLVAMVMVVSLATAFEYSGYCRQMCMVGRGGNLCKCSAVHFAGKRGLSYASDLEKRQESSWKNGLNEKLNELKQS